MWLNSSSARQRVLRTLINRGVTRSAIRSHLRGAIMGATMSHRFQHFLFSGFVALCVGAACPAQQPPRHRQTKQQKESEPPEEDDAAKPTEYAFNPLQAEHELKVGEFYMKKGSYAAAVARFTEATKWNPTLAEAYLELAVRRRRSSRTPKPPKMRTPSICS